MTKALSGTAVDNMNLTVEKELSWKFWSDGSKFADAKDVTKGFATMELEAGGASYQPPWRPSACLWQASTEMWPTSPTRIRANHLVVFATRPVACLLWTGASLRRFAASRPTTQIHQLPNHIKLKIGATEFLMNRHKDTEVSVASSANGSSVAVSNVASSGDYHTVTTAAARPSGR